MTTSRHAFRLAAPLRRAFLLALALSPIAASTHEYYSLDFTLIHPWADPTPEGELASAPIYFKMENVSRKDRLIRASTPYAETVEFRGGDEASAPRLEAIDIAPADQLDFGKDQPHMVLRNLKVPLQWGRSYQMTVVFEKAGALQVMVSVGAH
ncbi:copper chaperone PCu(A)C [Variovorax ginsengisoli]|uniref:Copper(I)-binding protein n=1 Tax=Variovorax ginsengisoli TaxID=363844 RepID=A0ABT9S460_9BURK|nr:copper chaperone PCu(A)C [Variovorax ginsengisoli]MDP9899129.1 copper(I)-binding protein [Variovorax ginsengisoli]